MAPTKINIFLTGATGYVGGSIISALLQHPNASNFHITALIRGNNERIEKLTSLNITPLIGSNDSFETIEKAAKEAHVVFHTANSADDLPSTKAIISGLNKQTKETGKAAIYIHTSGAGVLFEDVRGMKGSNIVYNDLDPARINSLSDKRLHREVDLFIIESEDANPLLKSVIVLPPLIYGNGTGPFHRTTSLLRGLTRLAVMRGKVEIIGEGEATWTSIHISDLVDAYIIIFDQLLTTYGPNAQSDASHSPYLTTGREGYYFTESGKFTWRQILEEVGEVLWKKGMINSPEVERFPDDEVERTSLGPYKWTILGCHMNSKAERVRKLGWKPYRPSLLDSVKKEVEAVINKSKD